MPPSLRLLATLVLCPILNVAQSALLAESPEPPSLQLVEVVPFANLTDQVADDWIGLGIAESIATALNAQPGIRVVRTDSPANPSPPTSSDWIISGSYRRLGQQIRLTGQVIAVGNPLVRHNVTVDGVLADLFTLQDQLLMELRPAFEPAGDPKLATAVTVAPPASLHAPSPERVATPAQTMLLPIDGPPAPEAPATINRDANGRATVRAVRLNSPFQLDGVLDEPVYNTVEPLTGFVQQQPNPGAPGSEDTEAWIFYDEHAIYVSARLWDSLPEDQWIANEMQRDSSQLISNDGFIAVFDTFYDRRNGFQFRVNPLGGFNDVQVTDEQCCGNSDWNPIWQVRTGRFDEGWTVEMWIPFKSLRFRPGPFQIWGVQLGRELPGRIEEVYLTPVPISAGAGQYRISAAATLTGLEVPTGNRTFEIKPYAIGSLATDRIATPQISNAGSGAFGVDVKYGLTENLTADFTYNTDFAQVEVDEQQVNLTRFSLFFPEKRDFFLESQGIFDFGQSPGSGFSSSASGATAPNIFFSRRIGLKQGQTVPILGGGRLTGKVGDFNIGAINIHSDDAPAANALATDFTVLRIKRDILRRSRIGGIFTGRSVSQVGNGSNEAYGLDGAFSFYDNVNFFGYYARTDTPGLKQDNISYQAAFSYDADLYSLRVEHLLVGDNYNPEVGFLRRDDFRRTFLRAQYSPRPAGIASVRQFSFGSSLDYILNGVGQIETRILQGSFRASLENSDSFSANIQQDYELLTQPFQIAPGVAIPVGGYEFQDFQLSYRMGPQRRLTGSFSVQHGEFFGGNITAARYSRGRLEITPQFSFEPSVSINSITLPQGDFTTKLASTRLTYTFTPRMFVGGLLQYNSTRNLLSTNVRLRWEYQPGSELFVVYNDHRDTELGHNYPLLENRAFIIKFTRFLRF